jgi:hypothetical protein
MHGESGRIDNLCANVRPGRCHDRARRAGVRCEVVARRPAHPITVAMAGAGAGREYIASVWQGYQRSMRGARLRARTASAEGTAGKHRRRARQQDLPGPGADDDPQRCFWSHRTALNFAGERLCEPLVLLRAWALIIVTRTEETD